MLGCAAPPTVCLLGRECFTVIGLDVAVLRATEPVVLAFEEWVDRFEMSFDFSLLD